MKTYRKCLWKTFLLIVVCCLLISGDVRAEKEKKITEISFKKYSNTLTIVKGEKVSLKVKIKPAKATNKTLKWKSSKKKIVAVTEDGVITGKKKGTAKITAMTTDDSNKKITLKVTVGNKISSLSYRNAEPMMELPKGTEYKLNVDIQPENASNKKLEWITSDSSIATVDAKGNVTAVSNGVVTITAKSTDGTNQKISTKFNVVTYVKSIEISVKKESPYWTELSEHGVFMMQGKSLALNSTILPETASDKTLIWFSDNTDVAIVSGNGVVTAVGSGIAIITAAAADNGGKRKTFYVYSSALDKGDCQYIAHRGLSEFAPENSLTAFSLALQSNYDSLELDVWATADREFVVSHNQSLSDTCDVDVKVSDITLAQATSYRIWNGNNVELYPNEYIPSLNQVLDLAQNYPEKNISIELKQVFSKEMLEKLMKDINQRDLQDRVKLITFYRANLATIRSLKELGGDEIALEYLSASPSDDAISVCKKYHADFGAKYTGLTQEQVQKIHELGLKVNVWTVSDYLDAYHMVYTMKVDYLTIDYQFFQ